MNSWTITNFFTSTQAAHPLTTHGHSPTSPQVQEHGVDDKEQVRRPRQEEEKFAQLAEESKEAARPPYLYVSGQ